MDGMAKALRHILEIIRDSRDDEMPVFDAILEQAARLCHAEASGLQLLNDAGTQVVYVHGWGGDSKWFQPGFEMAMDGPNKVPEAIRTASVINIEDLKDTDLYRQGYEPRRQLVDKEGIRSWLIVPLLKDGKGFGCLTLSRHRVERFSEDEVALVETFATQAAIAIENVRQYRELQSRLEREAATRETLEAISLSRDDEQPVFDVILRNASQLCHAPLVALALIQEDGRHYTVAAATGAKPEFMDFIQANPPELDPERYVAARAMVEKRSIHVDDLADPKLYGASDNIRVQSVALEGVRTSFYVPLLSGDQAIGALALYRRVVSPFSKNDVALLETFAEQAVIAIENARQFREVQERLRRERASSEVLEVISQSRDDEKPVFDAILDNACALCNAPLAGLILGAAEDSLQTLAAHKGMLPEAIELFETGQMRMDSNLSYAAQSIIEGRLIAFDDMAESDLYAQNSPVVRSMVDTSNIHSVLFVPLIKDGTAIGNLTLFRREVSPFSQSEISLVQTFAAQAVIAIENVRQFREVQIRLEREAASREILEIISQSRDDERPVLDAVTRNSVKLCNAAGAGLWLLNAAGDVTRLASTAQHKDQNKQTVVSVGLEFPRENASLMGKCYRDSRTMNVADNRDDPYYKEGNPTAKKLVDEVGMRSRLIVPLLENGIAFGCISLHRKEVCAFSDEEIALIESFAAQAVIAIENVRQFREVQTRLEREAATREILEVISQSRRREHRSSKRS